MIGMRGHQLGTELVLSLTHRHADSNNVTNREEDEQPNRPKLVVLLRGLKRLHEAAAVS